jgi:hypothetical protein
MLIAEEITASDFGRNFCVGHCYGCLSDRRRLGCRWQRGSLFWDHFAHKPGKIIKTHETADVAADFYHRYESDIALMHQMNIPASRFSIG